MIKFLRNLRRSLEAHWRASGRVARAAGVLLAAVLLICGLWLAVSSSGGDWAALPQALLNGRDSSDAQALLSSAGITTRRNGDKLLVPRESLRSARQLLAADASAAKDPAAAFQELASQDDIWRTQTQNDKRWQAAKMAVLSRLIAKFPSVESAAVILEPGSSRTLGAAAERPTAAVKVTIKEGARMSLSLATAISDLVAGSVGGMSSQDVRIVDGSGQSYRLADRNSAAAQEWERRRAAEAYYAEKARDALRYIDNLVVSVTFSPVDGAGTKLAAAVAVPRGYLAAVASTSGGAASSAEAGRLMTAELSRIQQTVAKVLNVAASDVYVEAYFDPGCLRGDDALAAKAPPYPWKHVMTAAGAGFAAAMSATVVAWLALRTHAARRRRMSLDAGQDQGSKREPLDQSAEAGRPGEANGLALLEKLTTQDVLAAIATEHPQTIATVLVHLAPAKAAAVLSGLEDAAKAEVSRRLTRIQKTDPALVGELARELAARAAQDRSAQPGAIDGEHKMAEILRHADPETEKAVLQALAGQAPGLADSVRKRMLVFEDIAELPPDRLAAALDGVSSEELAIALRAAAGETKDTILSALSPAASQRLREEMERIGPVRLSDVEAAQQRVAQAVRNAEAGRYASAAEERRQLLA